ncbi:unnamed protein product [Closterium sp. Naga37s-1]|nr:unnamed protein product [Closterium sp. Naga37s-1]
MARVKSEKGFSDEPENVKCFERERLGGVSSGAAAGGGVLPLPRTCPGALIRLIVSAGRSVSQLVSTAVLQLVVEYCRATTDLSGWSDKLSQSVTPPSPLPSSPPHASPLK